MRSLTAGISGQLTVSGAFPGWLVELTTSAGVLRYTSLDVGFTYNGFTWLSRQIDDPQLNWDGSIARSGRLVIGDADLALLSFALNLTLADAPIRIWQCYAAASNEAEPVFSGKCGESRFDRKALNIEIALTNGSDTRSVPNIRVQQVISSTFLIPEGARLSIAGQTWVIDRPRTTRI